MKESQGDFGASAPFLWSSATRVSGSTKLRSKLEDALQTRMQPDRLGLERLHRYPAMGAKLAAMASGKGLHDLPASHCGFDKRNKRKPKWVEFSTTSA
jgi:hypothetical protein